VRHRTAARKLVGMVPILENAGAIPWESGWRLIVIAVRILVPPTSILCYEVGNLLQSSFYWREGVSKYKI
jgi:hypothetical protein